MSTATAPSPASGPEVRAREAPWRRARFAEVLAAESYGRGPGRSPPGSPTRKGGPLGTAPPRPPSGRGAFVEEAASGMRPADPAFTGAPPPDRPAAGAHEPPGAAELLAYVRAAPPVIAAALRPGGAELALTFGSALSLDVRSGAQGLELTLRPASGLERTTRAELPGLVDALRARGLRVARAEVRPRAPPAPRRAR